MQEFLAGISDDMVAIDKFITIPDLEEHDSFDPCTCNCQSFANTIYLNDPNTVTTHLKKTAL